MNYKTLLLSEAKTKNIATNVSCRRRFCEHRRAKMWWSADASGGAEPEALACPAPELWHGVSCQYFRSCIFISSFLQHLKWSFSSIFLPKNDESLRSFPFLLSRLFLFPKSSVMINLISSFYLDFLPTILISSFVYSFPKIPSRINSLCYIFSS
jgi:hypothetical protein